MSDVTQPEAAQPQPAQPTAPAPAAWEPDPNAEPPKPNLAVGLVAGLILGLLAAGVYAAVTVISEREFLMLGILMGVAVAFGFYRFGHTKGLVAGVVAAIVAAAVYTVGVFLFSAGVLSKVYEVSFVEALRAVVENPKDVLDIYFEDPLSWVFFAISVAMSFFYAFRGAKEEDDEDEDEEQSEPAAPSQL